MSATKFALAGVVLMMAGLHTADSPAQSFYPLRVGNQWTYKDSSWGWVGNSFVDTSVVRIVSDTVMSNGKRYFRFVGNEAMGGLFARADSQAISYYNHYDSTDVPFYRLDVPVGSQWSVNLGPFFFASLASTGPLTWFGTPSTGKEYHFDGLSVTWVVLSEKFGPVAIWDQYDPPGSSNTLRLLIGAVISDTVYGTVVSVAPVGEMPEEFVLRNNYPNPFNPTTAIQFETPQRASVSLVVLDILGREVATLVKGELDAGVHIVHWDGTAHASGVYIYRLEANTHVESKRMMLIK